MHKKNFIPFSAVLFLLISVFGLLVLIGMKSGDKGSIVDKSPQILGESISDSPSYEWVKTIHTDGYDYSGLSEIDFENNTIFVGYLNGDQIVIDESTNETYTCTNMCMYINKIDENGNTLWFRFIETSLAGDMWSNDIYISPENNIYISGAFYDSVDFDTGLGEDIRTSVPTDYDGFLLKLLSNGDYAWTITLEGNGYDESFSSVEFNGFVYLTTEFYGTEIDLDPGLGEDIHLNPNLNGHSAIGKYSAANGTFVWGRSLGDVPVGATEGNVYADFLEIDTAGNLYLSGKFTADADFDWGLGEDLVANVGDKIFLIQFDEDSNVNWSEVIDKSSVIDIKYLSEINELIVYGSYSAGVPNQYTIYAKSYLPEKTISQDYSFSYPMSSRIIYHSDGSFYIAGRLQSAIDWDPGVGEVLQSAPASITGFIAEFGANHAFLNVKILPLYYPDSIKSLTKDELFLYGSYSGSIDFDPGDGVEINTAGTSNDIFIVKYDKTLQDDLLYKNLVQVQSYENDNGIIQTFEKDSNGNTYVVGYFDGTADLDLTDGEDSFSNPEDNNTEVFLSKYDQNNNYLWSKILVGTDSACRARVDSIVIDDENNVYTSGSYRYSCDFDPTSGNDLKVSISAVDGFIIKCDSDGNVIWVATNEPTYDGLKSLSFTTDQSSAYIFGETYIGLNPFINVYSVDTNSGVITEAWSQQVEGLSRGQSLSVDINDNIYFAGSFSGTTDFDPSIGSVVKTASGDSDAFLAKYNSLHELTWVKVFGGTSASVVVNDLVSDSDLNIYATGSYSNFGASIDFAKDFTERPFNDTFPTFCMVDTVYCSGAFVTKVDKNGVYGWTKAFGGDAGYSNNISIGFFNSNQVITISGYLQGTDIDLNSDSKYNLESSIADDTKNSPWFSIFNLDGEYIAGKILSETSVLVGSLSPTTVRISDNTINFFGIDAVYNGGTLDHYFSFWKNFEIDNESPEFTVLQVNEKYFTPTPTFSGTVADSLGNIGSISFYIDGNNLASVSCVADDGSFDSLEEDFTCEVSESLAVGSHTINFIASDSWENTSSRDHYSFTISLCGNHSLDLGEECDDGNSVNGDGCSNICEVELIGSYCGDGVTDTEEECDDGNSVNGDGCSNICEIELIGSYCGDGVIDTEEECDDGNSVNGDGCSNICEVELIGSYCGDGIVDDDEECDDGNLINNDNCSSFCKIEVSSAFCGNGVLEFGERCDDGNLKNRDGCSFICKKEYFCGNGVLEFGEDCDDGNEINLDGCNINCRLETDYYYCGNGNIDTGEECDDGNLRSGDGCSLSCVLETLQYCGNGILESEEECDDGNQISGDNCSAICKTEELQYCGDGHIDSSEECDDGNNNNNDGCSSDCVINGCGNAIYNLQENCDDGNSVNGDRCSMVCGVETYAYCGDGILQEGEICDDLNQFNGDGCSNLCMSEIDGYCGDGRLNAVEKCDDGNQNNGDGCSNICVLEVLMLKETETDEEIDELPQTGDENKTAEDEYTLTQAIVESLSKYIIPSSTGLGLTLQFLNLLTRFGSLPKFGKLLGVIFDKERKKHGWGIVYDIDRKTPVPFAIVRLYKSGSSVLVDETVTDFDGRYRFLVTEGKYTIGIEHADYVLPETDKLLMKNYDITGKYLGGEIEIRDDFAVAYDIPLLSKSMAEKNKKYHNLNDRFRIFMKNIGLWFNMVSGVLMIFAIIFSPTITNFILLGINISILLIIIYITKVLSKNWGYVYEISSGSRVKGVFVRLFDLRDNKLINTQITDNKGRYGFLANEGEYAVSVESQVYKQDQELRFKVEKKEKLLKKNIGVRKQSGNSDGIDIPFGTG